MNDSIKKSLLAAGLLDYFNNLAPSHQREYLKWIKEAKKQETQQKRIEKMIELLRSKRD